MSYTVIFKEEADYDVFDGPKWYESRRVGLGDEVLDEIEEYVKVLERDPQIYQARKHNWRYCSLKRFPYLIVFEIEQQEEVVVYAVFNTYQHPNRLEIRKTEE
jgi:mRNA-degrading endonuclease RelE of RelBE toxin-antitoxin system